MRAHNLLALCVLLVAGCSAQISLTDPGRLVRRVESMDVPVGCRIVGDVNIGTPPDAARPPTEEDLVTLMRNRAGENGGNVLVVETQDRRTGAADEVYYVGRGRSYRCPPESSGDSSPSEGDATDGLPAEEGAEEEESAGGEDEGSDEIVDDLLAD